MILWLLLLLADPSHPLIDEGSRWESATLVRTFDRDGEKQSRLIFWRRDSFNRLWPAGETDWNTLTNWHADEVGVRFTWSDGYEGCVRTLRVPSFHGVDVPIDVWRVSWPTCPADMRGFLPNPERRDPE